MSIKIKGSTDIYDVTWDTCTCPHFQFRLIGTGKICKHIELARKEHPKLISIALKEYDLKMFETVETDKLPFTEEELKDMQQKGLIMCDRQNDKYKVIH